VGSSSACQRVQSRLHILELDDVGEDTFERIFHDKGVIALFEEVYIHGVIWDIRRIEKLVVDEGVISTLKIACYDLDDDDSIQLAKMLEVNRLETLDLRSHPGCSSLAHALVDSLNQHVQTFADQSILRDLDLQNSLCIFCRLDPNAHDVLYQDLVNVIGNLPNLISFGIHEPNNSNGLPILAEAIGNWKIRRFKLWRSMREDVPSEQYCVKLSHLFDSIKSSMYLKELSIGAVRHETLEEVWTTHLFELALSTRSGLLEIELPRYTIPPLLVSTLVVEDCDRAIALKRHLRRFGVFWDDSLSFQNLDARTSSIAGFDDMGDEEISDYVRSLLWLVSKHLPYLYDVGTDLSGGTELENRIHQSQDSALVQIWQKVLAQMELNRVGMALLQSEVLPTVPSGLWPRVLHRAVVCEANETQLPWTGIYTMVRALVEDGHIGCGESRADTTRDGFPSTKKRPRQ